MERPKRSRRSYGAGEWGRNWMRIFPDPRTGYFQIEWRENGRRLTRSLGHRDWARAKRQADEFAAGFVGPDLNGETRAEPEPHSVSIGGLTTAERVAVALPSLKPDASSVRVVVHQRARARGPAHGPIQEPAKEVSAGRGQGPSHTASPVQQAARFGHEALARPEGHHDDATAADDPVLQVAGDVHSLPDSRR